MSSGTQSRPRILIVEDDQTLSDQLSGLLTSKGYQVQQCFEGDQALLDALSLRLDLILLDVLLPRMNGFDVLERLRKTRQTPVMMLTACGAEEERILGYQQGADDYLPKPFNPLELTVRIQAVLKMAWRCWISTLKPSPIRTSLSSIKRCLCLLLTGMLVSLTAHAQ